MQGGHWIMNAKSRLKLYFPEFLGCEKYIFLKQRYKQVMPEALQSHLSVCGFHTRFAAFHLSKIRQEETTGVQDLNFFSFTSDQM